MGNKYISLPRRNINVNASTKQGPMELWRHTIGHGGINSLPLPERLIDGSKKLRPKLVRTFIQEYFDIYPEQGRFDWSKLDPYMESLAATGAKVVAAITIKPKVLFPEKDHSVWIPNHIEEWQNIVFELVTRYSVDKPIVTYWEIGNEPDIGEPGGSPYLIKKPADYIEYYKMAIKPILEAFPEAKVGGPASTDRDRAIIPALIEYCENSGLQLDFVSFHCYSDDIEYHLNLVKEFKEVVSTFPGKRPELLLTEFNKDFDAVLCEDMAFDPWRSAILSSIIIALTESGPDWSFYYHIWDQTNYKKEFERFFNDPSIMIKHWNEIPHRFGLFGVSGEVRPQYFVYQMLSRMCEERIEAHTDDPDLRVMASNDERNHSVFFVNHNNQESSDMIVSVNFSNINPGTKILKVYRIDEKQKWSSEDLELIPIENREIDTLDNYFCQIYCPKESVVFLTLEEVERR